MAWVFLLSLLAVQILANPDFTYNFWLSPATDPCVTSVCPYTPNHPGWYGTCVSYSGTGYNVGINVTNTSTTADFKVYFFGGATGGCLGQEQTWEIVTCLTCLGYYYIPATEQFVCFQVVNQSQCGNSLPTSPPSPNPPAKKGNYLEEHYEKSSSTEKYDRIEKQGKDSSSSSPSAVSEESLWSSRLPQHLRNYFATSQAAAVPPQPTTTTSPLVYFIMALTFGVVIGVGSYMAKRVQKRSEYVPIKESADKDSLLFS